VDDEPSDREIVARVRSGNPDEFRFLVMRHYPACLRYAVRMLGNRQDGEEAAQDALVRAYRFLGSWDGKRPFGAWLSGILVNCCRTSGARRLRVDRPLVSYDAGDASLSTHPAAEDGDEVQMALMKLPPLLREAVLLKFVDDRTYEEIAESTGTRVSALKMRVKRARAQLEALLR
jgi:RNA polymerase sigma-70 factor (ECF subfamily)